jgi:predicted DNA-binding transcriptional regulator YafY
MPASGKYTTILRQWEMLKLIPTSPASITAQELTQRLVNLEYPVNKRTVERDLNALSGPFSYTCLTDTQPYRWHWIRGKALEIPGIGIADALCLGLSECVLKTLLPKEMLEVLEPKFALARTKLSHSQGNTLHNVPQKYGYVPATLSHLPPTVNMGVFETIQDALIQELQVTVSYAAFNEKEKLLTLHPLSIIQKGTIPYLVATAFGYTDVRLYAIHRIQSAEMTRDRAVIPSDFTTEGYIAAGAMEFGSGDEIKLKASLSKELATYLTEAPLSADQKISYKADGYELTATVRDSWELTFWILSQGSSITVKAPKSLRTRMAETLVAALKKYQED